MALQLLLITLAVTTARADEEQDLIAKLQSTAGIPDKCAACQRLRVVGTAKSVPALAALLGEERVGHAARYALEGMPYDEAGAALRMALGKTAGLIKAGVIDSLGWRRDPAAVPLLVPLLADPDPTIAATATAALGKIGDAKAVVALFDALARTPYDKRGPFYDALFQSAESLLTANDRPAAENIYRNLIKAGFPPEIRRAAFRGLVLMGGERGQRLFADALNGKEPLFELEAWSVSRSLPGSTTTKLLVDLLPKLPAPRQAELINLLADRADKSATPAVMAAVKNSDAAVRRAALAALVTLGDATAVPILLEAAGDDRKVARATLSALSAPGVNDALVSQLGHGDAARQTEIVRCLAARGAKSALPKLLDLACAGNMVAVAAIGDLAGPEAVGALLQMLGRAKTDTQRTALLSALGRIGGAEAWRAVRTATEDPQPAVRDAAIRTMAERGGLELAPDLLKLAGSAPTETQRVLALRGYWRVVGTATDRPVQERWKLCEAGMAASQRAEEKRLGIAELAKLSHPGAIRLLKALCEDATVKDEALKALDGLQQYVGYIDTWLVAGPYRQPGKQCAELFDIAFAPEQPGATGVTWKTVPAAWQIDLLPYAGGDQCVVYLRTRVFSPKEQAVRLEIGSDDGNKMWVNGKLVHANNVQRPIQSGQDKADAALREGWNDFLVKVTQNVMGFAVCIRVRSADGGVIDGLKCDNGAVN